MLNVTKRLTREQYTGAKTEDQTDWDIFDKFSENRD
jgi:hypothetical protein